ncbi:MAG: anthranilate synthase component I family protein, partial [Phycisphaerae bacterium]
MPTYHPEYDEFARLAEQGNLIPVYAQLIGDHLTPVTAFANIARTTDHAFLLESVVGGEKIARYSFIAASPYAVFEATRENVRISAERGVRKITTGDPLGELEKLLAGYRAVHLPRLPRFVGGAVGYAAYDMVRYYERLPNAPADDRGLPDLLFGLYDTMVIFDHVQKTILVVSHAHVKRDGLRNGYENACARIERTIETLAEPPGMSVGHIAVSGDPTLPFRSSFTREGFENAVSACKEYIRAGDIFQVVLSQRLDLDTQAAPFNIYRALRVVNPSPFMFYLKSPKVVLVGSSPEIMCRVEDGVVTNRPLAGTRRRGRTEEEDLALERELLADPKERAEHI